MTLSILPTVILLSVTLACGGGRAAGPAPGMPGTPAPISPGNTAMTTPTQDPRAEILAFENAWMVAVQKRDAAALDRILSDDYLLLGSTGETMTKRQYIDGT